MTQAMILAWALAAEPLQRVTYVDAHAAVAAGTDKQCFVAVGLGDRNEAARALAAAEGGSWLALPATGPEFGQPCLVRLFRHQGAVCLERRTVPPVAAPPAAAKGAVVALAEGPPPAPENGLSWSGAAESQGLEWVAHDLSTSTAPPVDVAALRKQAGGLPLLFVKRRDGSVSKAVPFPRKGLKDVLRRLVGAPKPEAATALPGTPGPGWHPTLAAARAAARASGKPVLAVCALSFCPPCRELERALETDHGLKAFLASVEPVRLVLDQQGAAERGSLPATATCPTTYLFRGADDQLPAKTLVGFSGLALWQSFLEAP